MFGYRTLYLYQNQKLRGKKEYISRNDCMTETTICSANIFGPNIVKSVYVNHFIHFL